MAWIQEGVAEMEQRRAPGQRAALFKCYSLYKQKQQGWKEFMPQGINGHSYSRS